jgi:hypothetical protein
MRLEFIGHTKGKVTKVGGFTIKLGQKDTRPAAWLRVMATVPNDVLDKFSPGMREFLFEKAKGGEKVQKQLDGVEVVSDLPNLREPGVKLGALHWDDEQTGCAFIVDRAIDPIKVGDCKVNKFKIAPKDGGTVQVFFTLTTGELDRETAGELVLLNQQEIVFELTAPAPLSSKQQSIEPEEPGLTPLQAMKDGKPAAEPEKQPGDDGTVWPFPTTAHDETKPAVKVTTKKSRKVAAA